MTDQLDAFARVLGGLLRSHRRARGLSRHEVVSKMDNEVSVQTLASWELGTRNLGVSRLVEVSHALDVRPGTLVGRAHDLVFGTVDVPLAILNLADLADTEVPELQPLRPWADLRARELPPGCTPELPLTRASLNNLATLCRTTPFQLIRLLRP
jgi:transcriptional regulator with XRE-family HTH domain